MKIAINILIVSFLVCSAYVVKASESEAERIAEYEGDVTGDGTLETIELYGIPFSPDSVYYRDIYVTIRSAEEEWRINYQGGYEPTIQLIDLNHDGTMDIFYQSATGGSGGLYTSRLDTFVDKEVKNIVLPKQEAVKGYFAEGFYAMIELSPTREPVKVNVEDRKENYIRMGIYNKDGELRKQTSLLIDPIAFYDPIEVSEKQGYGLKSYKQISGAYHADRLGVIETLWYYEDGKWIALQTEWKETGEYDASKFY